MTATVTEIEILESLDFDHSIKCEANGKNHCDHQNDATVVVTLACCGVQRFFCNTCLMAKLNMTLLICSVCGAITAPSETYSRIDAL